jgi:hypothetical protein
MQCCAHQIISNRLKYNGNPTAFGQHLDQHPAGDIAWRRFIARVTIVRMKLNDMANPLHAAARKRTAWPPQQILLGRPKIRKKKVARRSAPPKIR